MGKLHGLQKHNVRSLLPLLLFLTILLLVPSRISAADELWKQAMDHYLEAEGWVPFAYGVEQKLYNGGGELLNHARMTMRIGVDDTGELTYAIEDQQQLVGKPMDGPPFGGGDDGSSGGERFEAAMLNPLDAAVQENVTVRRIGSEQLKDGRTIVKYAFTLEAGRSSKAEGIVWIDRELGIPVRIERELDPPFFMIRRFAIIEEYADFNGVYLTSSLTFDIIFSFLIKREFRIEMDFRDHRYNPAVAELMGQGRPAGGD